MNIRGITTTLFLLHVLAPAVAFSQSGANASAELKSDVTHIHAGSDLTFKLTLNDPLPPGAYFQVRLSPVKVDQELPVSSGEPTDKERKEFVLHVKLPDGAIPGDWHIQVVYLFLAGTSWTGNTISTNPMPFVVEGVPIAIPTKGTAEIVSK